jgi:hypothetical protein
MELKRRKKITIRNNSPLGGVRPSSDVPEC